MLRGIVAGNGYQLDEKFRLHAARAFVLRVGALRQKRIDFVDEDHRRLLHPKEAIHFIWEAIMNWFVGFLLSCLYLATAKRARTIFSPSPTHLEVRVDALMLKNVDLDWLAMHLPALINKLSIRV